MANNVNNGITGVIDIPGALRSRGAADGNQVGGVVAYAGDIYDTTASKNQATINSDVSSAISNIQSNLFSGDYDDLRNKPTLSNVATSGSISDTTEGLFSITENPSWAKLLIATSRYKSTKPWGVAIGDNSMVYGQDTFCLGNGLKSTQGVAVGRYNTSSDNVVFTLGFGTADDNRKNAIIVDVQGNVYLYGVNGYTGGYISSVSSAATHSLTQFANNLNTRLTTLEGSSSSSPTYSAGTGVSISNNTISVDSSTYKVKDVQDGNGDSLVSNGIASVTANDIYDSDFSYQVYDAYSGMYKDWYEYTLGEQQPYNQSRINSLLLSKYPNDSFIKLSNQACGCAISDYDVATGQNSLSNQQSSIGGFGNQYTNSFELSDYVPLGSIVRDSQGALFNIKGCAVYNKNSQCQLDGFVSNLNTATVYGNAYGKYSHAEGGRNSSFGAWSHAEGYNNSSVGEWSHAEGHYTIAVGKGSHAEGGIFVLPGYGTIDSFTEDGNYIILTVTGPVGSDGYFIYIPTFYDGLIEIIDNQNSNNKIKIAKPNTGLTMNFNKLVGLKYLIWEEGPLSGAIGEGSHTEGSDTSAIGAYSHAEGVYTTTSNYGEHASGKYNLSNKAEYNQGNIVTDGTLFSIGVGISDSTRENAFEVLTNGQVYIKGIGDYDGTNPTMYGVKSVQQVIAELTQQIAALTNN